MNVVLEGYAAAATSELVAQFEAIPSQGIYGPVLDLLPSSPVRVVDIGAGIGRDAASLASRGHRVLAVEPVRELREAGVAIHATTEVERLDDRLPDLVETRLRGRFDLVVIGAVWQHLKDGERQRAMCSLAKLAAPGGMMILSLRHRPGCRATLLTRANLTLGAYLLSGSKLATAAFIEARGSRRMPQELQESSAYAERSPPALCLISSVLVAHAIAMAAPSRPCRRGHPLPVVPAGAVAGQDRYGSRTRYLLTALKGGNGGR